MAISAILVVSKTAEECPRLCSQSTDGDIRATFSQVRRGRGTCFGDQGMCSSWEVGTDASRMQTVETAALPSRIRLAVHFEGAWSRDANFLVRAGRSRDVVVPMLCHFACRAARSVQAEPGTVAAGPAKPLARIRNRLKITCCSVMLARTVHAQARTAPGSRAQTRSDDALAGSLPQLWSTAGSCRSTLTLRETRMSSLKTEPPPHRVEGRRVPTDPGGRQAFHPDSLLQYRFLQAKKIWLSSRALHAVFR